jgi:hypothetical protein
LGILLSSAPNAILEVITPIQLQIAIHATPRIILPPQIQITAHRDFRRPARPAIQLIPDGNLHHSITQLSRLLWVMQAGHVQIAILEEITRQPLRIVMPAIRLIIIILPIRIIKPWHFQQHVHNAIPQILDGHLQDILLTIPNSSRSIQEDIMGLPATNAIQILPTIHNSIASFATAGPIAVRIIQMRNVIIATPGELQINFFKPVILICVQVDDLMIENVGFDNMNTCDIYQLIKYFSKY